MKGRPTLSINRKCWKCRHYRDCNDNCLNTTAADRARARCTSKLCTEIHKPDDYDAVRTEWLLKSAPLITIFDRSIPLHTPLIMMDSCCLRTERVQETNSWTLICLWPEERMHISVCLYFGIIEIIFQVFTAWLGDNRYQTVSSGALSMGFQTERICYKWNKVTISHCLLWNI